MIKGLVDILLKLVEKLIKDKGLWPIILLIVSLSGAFFFTQHFYAMTFRDVWSHWLFRLMCAGVFLVTAILLLVYVRPDAARILWSLPFVVFAWVCLGLGTIPWRAEKTEEKVIVVAVARFRSVTPEATIDAENLRDRIIEKLQSPAYQPFLRVRELSAVVEGEDEREREHRAIQLGQAPNKTAHLILWADVRKDGKELRFKPRLSVANEVASAKPLKRREIDGFSTRDVAQIESKEFVADEIAQTISVIAGEALIKTAKFADARLVYEEAAERGNARAQTQLGLLYIRGEGGASNWSIARRWLEAAANQGNSDAQFNLGIAAWRGFDGKPDPTNALKWFRLAADQDHVLAQLYLGNFYGRAIGVPRDTREANMWFSRLDEALTKSNPNSLALPLKEAKEFISREQKTSPAFHGGSIQLKLTGPDGSTKVRAGETVSATVRIRNLDDFNDSLLFENVALQIHLNAGTKSSSNLLAKPIFIKKYGDALQLSYEFTVGSGEGKQAGKQRLLFVDANATGLDQHDGGSKRKAAQQFFMTFPALIEIVD